jgi:superfamily II DNA or RNA helicase
MTTLRPYQREAVEAVRRGWRTMRSVAMVMATGLGKTETFNAIAADLQRQTGGRILILADRIELIESTAARMRHAAPDLTVGIVMAERNQTLADIVVGCVATVRGEARLRQLLNVRLIVIDECHGAAAAGYRKILAHFPQALVLGVTATFSRADGRALGEIFEDVVYEMPISAGIEQGFLVRPRGLRVAVDGLSMRGVRRTAGDYNEADLQRVLGNSPAPAAIVKALREHAPDDAAVCFTPGVEFARVMHEAFSEAGFTSAYLHANTPRDERRQIKQDVEDGRIQVVSNCGIWVQGTDIPRLKTAIIGPTMSNVGYIQKAGRVLRPYPGYTSALIMDYGGASARFSLDARVELFGDEVAEELEREPCECLGAAPCPCGRRPCLESCACGGGPPGVCACTRPEKVKQLDEPVPDDTPRVDGDIVTVEVDLFHQSRNHWLITSGGTWFLPAGDRFIAVVPGRRRNTWSAVAMHRAVAGEMEWIVRDIPDKAYAMAWGEGAITKREHRSARKTSSWRAEPPTAAQRALAAQWHIAVDPFAHGGEVADQINRAQASARMDARVALLREAQE